MHIRHNKKIPITISGRDRHPGFFEDPISTIPGVYKKHPPLQRMPSSYISPVAIKNSAVTAEKRIAPTASPTTGGKSIKKKRPIRGSNQPQGAGSAGIPQKKSKLCAAFPFSLYLTTLHPQGLSALLRRDTGGQVYLCDVRESAQPRAGGVRYPLLLVPNEHAGIPSSEGGIIICTHNSGLARREMGDPINVNVEIYKDHS